MASFSYVPVPIELASVSVPVQNPQSTTQSAQRSIKSLPRGQQLSEILNIAADLELTPANNPPTDTDLYSLLAKARNLQLSQALYAAPDRYESAAKLVDCLLIYLRKQAFE